MTRWAVAQAKAQFSQLIESVHEEGALEITRNGKVVGVLVSPEEWKRKNEPPPVTNTRTTSEFFRKSPLRGSDLDLSRNRSAARRVRL